MNLGYTRDVEVNEISKDLLAQTNLTAKQIQEVKEALPTAVEEASALLTEA
jgi:hypothetical protein